MFDDRRWLPCRQRSYSLFSSYLFLVSECNTPVGADDQKQDETIGSYLTVTGEQKDLFEEHIKREGGELRISPPHDAENLYVENEYLASNLGAWAADHQFVIQGGQAEFDAEQIRFRSFAPSDEAWFTAGSAESIQYTSRPMWTNVSQQYIGSQIQMEIYDGDTSGAINNRIGVVASQSGNL